LRLRGVRRSDPGPSLPGLLAFRYGRRARA